MSDLDRAVRCGPEPALATALQHCPARYTDTLREHGRSQILTSFAQGNNNSGVKFDRTAFGRGFALGVPRFQRASATKVIAQPVFSLVPSQPASSELPHHKELRLLLSSTPLTPGAWPAFSCFRGRLVDRGRSAVAAGARVRRSC
jgi:hypothetical protein